LGVRVVYDLRGDIERTEYPGRLPSVHAPIVGRAHGSPALGSQAGVTTSDGETILRDMYVGILEHSATQIGAILRGLSEPGCVPAVFHCHGGKDRTGVVAAVLLLALGVDTELVLDDYVVTSEYRRFEHQQDSLANMLAQGLPLEAAVGVLGTPRWAMAAVVTAIAEQYGGIDAYLTHRAGLSPDAVTALREALVDQGA
jgi:protein-tyrosine phosphatase